MNNITMKYLAFILGVTFIIPSAICDIAHENLLSATTDEASFVDPNLNHRGQNLRRSLNDQYGNRRLKPSGGVTSPATSANAFVEVGQGNCIDSNDAHYSFFSRRVESEYDCLSRCSQKMQHSQLVGASFNSLLSHCLCHFTGGLPSDLNLASFSPAAQQKGTDTGTGTVSGTDDTTDIVCFKKDKAQ
jgi:hypothetical protein